MTALAGFWDRGSGEDLQGACSRMLKSQALYGPHGEAQWSDNSICVGRRLFRTLPEDVHDRAPVLGGGGRFALVADIRIDNRAELLGDLSIDAGVAGNLADAALLMRGYERWGEAILDRLVGDFAFALWDSGIRRLILARDFLGQRPLHYHSGNGFFAFASMPKGLHCLPQIPYRLDQVAVADFLVLMPEEGPGTFFEGIARVEPGQIISITERGITARKYWQPSLDPIHLADSRDYAEAVRERMDLAVAARLRGAANQVAAHLSAGLDSGTVTATAARLLSATGGKVIAFTSVPRAGFQDPVYADLIGDEGPLAAATAAHHPNIDHVRIENDGVSPLDALDRNFFLFDRPMPNLCNAVWWDAINDAARERGLPIMLTGQMGNMSFSWGGMELLPQLLATGKLAGLVRLWSQMMREGSSRRSLAINTFGPFLPGPIWKALRLVTKRVLRLGDYSMIEPAAAARLGVLRRASERGLDFSYRPRIDGRATRLLVLNRVDRGNYNKGALGGWGVDLRDPTADRRLIELCLRIPTEHYLCGGRDRALARNAFRDRLPPIVVEGKRGGLQGSDWYEGLSVHRDDLAVEIARLAESGVAAGTLKIRAMQQLVDDWPVDGWDRHMVVQRYRLALLRGISAGHFVRKAAGTNG